MGPVAIALDATAMTPAYWLIVALALLWLAALAWMMW